MLNTHLWWTCSFFKHWCDKEGRNWFTSQELLGIFHILTYVNKKTWHDTDIWTCGCTQHKQSNDPTKTCFRTCRSVSEVEVFPLWRTYRNWMCLQNQKKIWLVCFLIGMFENPFYWNFCIIRQNPLTTSIIFGFGFLVYSETKKTGDTCVSCLEVVHVSRSQCRTFYSV